MGEKARKLPFSTDFLSKIAHAADVITISMEGDVWKFSDIKRKSYKFKK